MEARITFRLSSEEHEFVLAQALKASKPVKGGMVKPSEFVRNLIAKEMAKHKSETQEAA